MTLNVESVLDILRFYRDIEFFNPFDFDKLKQSYSDDLIEIKQSYTAGNSFICPWEDLNKEDGRSELYNLDPEYEYNYDLYLAPFDRGEIKKLLLEKLPDLSNEKYTDAKVDEGLSCFARIRISHFGFINTSDIAISTLPWANVSFNKNQELNMKSFDDFCSKFLGDVHKLLTVEEKESALNYKNILSIGAILTEDSNLNFYPQSIFAYLLPHRMRKKININNTPNDSEQVQKSESDSDKIYRKVEILNSFYLRDLERISESFKSKDQNISPSNPLKSYFRGMLEEQKEKIDIVKNPAIMEANCKLIARWPSDPNISLSQTQEFALHNYFSSNECLQAINGPPGTGKSFIIRDLIANLIVKRAYALTKFKRPENAFKSDFNDVTIGGKSLRYRELEDSLTGYELIIASSNNTAVNNISKELPLKKSLGEEFQDAEYLLPIAEMYFRADELFGYNTEYINTIDNITEVWGFPSVALGKKANRSKLINTSFYPPKEEKEKNKQFRIDNQLLSFFEWRKVAPDNSKSYKKSRQDFLVAYENILQLENNKSIEEINIEKSKLFLLALNFQEAWLREVPRLENEFTTLAHFIRNPANAPSTDSKHLWHLFFMFIPVISSTLASVERQFKSTPRETLGNLVIDEAGQATPQSAIGILQKVKKALILGDQRQLEPICPLPSLLVTSLAKKINKKVFFRVSPLSSSVQSISDNQNKYGTYLSEPEGSIWIATPLLEHRRCLEPMFGLSNSIAYDGMMKYHSEESEYFSPLGESGWYQIEGECFGKQWVPNQGQLAENLITQLIRNTDDYPDFFFISPFREVVNNLKFSLGKVLKNSGLSKESSRDLNQRIGTTHSFQGKEADIVFFILGGDHKTVGACEWAGMKPNLLNVAITRAKKRLYVIGDRNVWHNKGYFSDLQKKLPIKI